MGPSQSRFVLLLVGALLLLWADGVLAQSDSVVLVGVGQTGPWVTEMTAANPAESSLLAHVSPEPHFEPLGPCPGPCPFVYFGLGPNGTQALDPLLVGRLAAGETVTTLYITPEDGKPLPPIRARVVNTSRPEQAISVPGFRLSTLLALNPINLSFPGARRSVTERTNLALADLKEPNRRSGSGLSIQVEVYGSSGLGLSSASYTLAPGETRFLVDLLGQLGISNLENGQVRVRKTAGEGHVWGTMFTTDSDGTVTVSVGAHP
jgi:hypothetical protein